MYLKNLKHSLGRHITNLPGWRTNRKIVVIESDDWGSIRMPSREVYEKCLKAGYPVDKNPYERYDSLASEEDLTLMFDLLKSFKDKNGNHPVVTANCVVANPDFKKIREDGFRKYHYELINETFKRYPKHQNNLDLWKQGLAEQVFFPQFHAREHLNVSLFMEALQKGDRDALWGFENEMPGSVAKGVDGLTGNHYVEATKYNSESDKNQKLVIYLEGLTLFKQLFGYASKSIIPPNYIWSPDFNKAVCEKGVIFFQGNRKMKEPAPEGRPVFHSHYLGKQNDLGQRYLVRNASFEPSLLILENNDPVNHCLSDMAAAFRLRKPAIISSHRINYVGFIDPKNRCRSLLFLTKLLKRVLRTWPDVEFMTSIALGELIAKEV